MTFKNQFLKNLCSETHHRPWGISILAAFRPMGYKFSSWVVFGLGKNLLFKSILGHCVHQYIFQSNKQKLKLPAFPKGIFWRILTPSTFFLPIRCKHKWAERWQIAEKTTSPIKSGWLSLGKSQLISEWNFSVFKSPRKATKFWTDFYPTKS